MLAVLDVHLELLEFVVEGGLQRLLLVLQHEDMALEGLVLVLQLHDVLLQTDHELALVVHPIIIKTELSNLGDN